MAAQVEGQSIGAMGERVARIEGAYEHLATKADVESVKTEVNAVNAAVQSLKAELQAAMQSLRTEVHSEIAGMKSELRWIKWALGILVVGVLLPLLQTLLERFS